MDIVSEEEIKKQVSILKSVLPTVDKASIESELRKYLDKYLLPLENAKCATVRSFNGTDETLEALESIIPDEDVTHIRDLQIGMDDVTLSCFITYFYPKEIVVRGEPKTIIKGELIDEGLPIEVTFWGEYNLEEDSHVFLTHMKVGEFRGELNVQSTNQTKIIIQKD